MLPWPDPAPSARLRQAVDGLASSVMSSAEPAQFQAAVAAMNAVEVRPEIELGPIRPPQRLAPFSYALGAEVRHPETAIVPERSEGDAFGRLILLHDPEGAEAWDGTMRLVAYIQADLDSSEAVDPLLPEVAWSWLVDALEARAGRPPRWAAPSPPPHRCATATSPVRRGPTSSSCAHRGPRRRWSSEPMSRRSARCSSMQRACRRRASPTWGHVRGRDGGRVEQTTRRPRPNAEPAPTPLLRPPDGGVPELTITSRNPLCR